MSKSFTSAQSTRTPLSLSEAALAVGATPAELAAVLQLASLDDESLALIASRSPPATTWFDLAEATPEGVVAALDALAKRPKSASAKRVVEEAIKQVRGPDLSERLSKLSGESISAIHRRAQRYKKVLREEDLRFLKGLGRQVARFGKPATLPQRLYLGDLLIRLKQAGALEVQFDSGEARACEEVLRLLEEDA